MNGRDATFAMVAEERRTLADLVDSLTAEQLATPSLCGEWTVHEVVAHLVVPLEVAGPTFLLAILRNRGSFDRANVEIARRLARRPADDLAASLRANAEHRFTPPGAGPAAPLTDALVHGSDIRRPLGIDREWPADRSTIVLDFLTGGTARGFVPRRRTAGLRFVATDVDWSAGTGPTVEGPVESLLLAITGRPAGFDELTGDGVAALRSRLG